MLKRTLPLITGMLFFANPVCAEELEKCGPSFCGNVSWYGVQFQGRRTASGERFDMNKCTGAHRRLPFHTRVLLEDPRSGNACIVKVNDRGPWTKSRVMDVSKAAALRLELIGKGVAFMECTVVSDKAKTIGSSLGAPASSRHRLHH